MQTCFRQLNALILESGTFYSWTASKPPSLEQLKPPAALLELYFDSISESAYRSLQFRLI